ncbi:hypothetical protein WME73_23580 [Sorangium sp. So ce302]
MPAHVLVVVLVAVVVVVVVPAAPPPGPAPRLEHVATRYSLGFLTKTA